MTPEKKRDFPSAVVDQLAKMMFDARQQSFVAQAPVGYRPPEWNQLTKATVDLYRAEARIALEFCEGYFS